MLCGPDGLTVLQGLAVASMVSGHASASWRVPTACAGKAPALPVKTRCSALEAELGVVVLWPKPGAGRSGCT